ncbi:hypothetical protein VNI00_006149 [Paramarasmius palmivorus]|uniref:Zn(2)-C6 fungal-type domain-containing protein n=1 Tax=Paramarasmius palmivorus TaxID=297713 RepID=A0AAW0DAA4_9AGAR
MTSTPNSPSSPPRNKSPSKQAKELVPDSEEENGGEESVADDSTRQDSANVDEGDDSVDGEVEVPEAADTDPIQLASNSLSEPSTTFTPSKDLQGQFSANYHHTSGPHSEARKWAEKYNHLVGYTCRMRNTISHFVMQSCERCKEFDLVCKPFAGNGLRATACSNCSLSSREPCSNTENARRDRLKSKFNLDDVQYEVLRKIHLSRDRPKRSIPKKQKSKSASTTKVASRKETEEEEGEVSDEGEDELDDEVEEEEVTLKRRRKVTVHRDDDDDENPNTAPLDEDEGSPEAQDESRAQARNFMPSKDLQEQFSATYYYGAHNEAREWIKENGHLPCERCRKHNIECSMPPGPRATKCNPCATASRAPCSKTEDARRVRLKAKFHLDDTQYDILRKIHLNTNRPKRGLAAQKSTGKVANKRSSERVDDEPEAPEGKDDTEDPEESSESEEEVVTARRKNKIMVPKVQSRVSVKKKQLSTSQAGLRAGGRARKPTAKAAANVIPEKPINKASAPRRTMSRLLEDSEDLEDSDDEQPLEQQARTNVQPCTPRPSTSTTLAGSKRRRPLSLDPSDCSTLVHHSTASPVTARPPRPSPRNRSVPSGRHRAIKRRIEDISTELRYKRTSIQDLLNEYDAIANELGEMSDDQQMDVDQN